MVLLKGETIYHCYREHVPMKPDKVDKRKCCVVLILSIPLFKIINDLVHHDK